MRISPHQLLHLPISCLSFLCFTNNLLFSMLLWIAVNILAFGSQAAAHGQKCFCFHGRSWPGALDRHWHLSCSLAKRTSRQRHALQPRPGVTPYKQVPTPFCILSPADLLLVGSGCQPVSFCSFLELLH